jgi:cation transport regulator
MPYRGISDLRKNLRDVLPKHAQEIYVKAYNSAFEEYKDPDDRRHDDSREETAHRVAWAAVKKTYHKGSDDKWHRNAK